MVLVAIVAIHIFLGWAFASGLARKAIQMVAPPIQTDIAAASGTVTRSRP